MKPQTQAALTAGIALLGFYLLGGCCIGTGLDLGGGGKSVYLPQIIAGVGMILVPTLAVGALFIAHLLGYRPEVKAKQRQERHQRHLESLQRPLSPPQDGDNPQVPTSWAPVAELEDAVAHLGRQEAKFLYTDRDSNALFNFAFCGVGGVVLLAVGCFVLATQKALALLPFILLPLGALLAAVGGVGFAVSLKPKDMRTLIYTRGLVRVEGGRFLVFLWDDILELYQIIVDVYQYGLIHTAREYGFTLFRCDGEPLKIVEGVNIRDIGPLSDILQGKIAEHRLPQVKRQFKAGETLVFGPLRLNRQGISNEDETIPWREVEAIQIAKGVITIRRANKWLSWSTTPASEIPNLHVFLSLVDLITGVNKKPT